MGNNTGLRGRTPIAGRFHPVNSARWLAVLLAGLLSACAGHTPTSQAEAPVSVTQSVPDSQCQSGPIALDANFDGGQLGRCQPGGAGEFLVTLFPEDAPPINKSPWYSFRISGEPGERVRVRLNFEHADARYWPKVSYNGLTWQIMPLPRVKRIDEGQAMLIDMELQSPVTYVSAQELMTNLAYEHWLAEMQDTGLVTQHYAGSSVQGRPLVRLQTQPRPEVVLLLGRQHPPEVSGAFAMRYFVRTLLEDSALANQFRERFQLVMFPLLNPDGVALGHWRHNVGGVDLNRDWGPFTQPETRAVKRWLDDFDAGDQKFRLMLDFHSTQRDLLYTQTADELTNPANFAIRWLEAVAEAFPDYEFLHDPRPVNDSPTSKTYFYRTYGIPAITHETGDETIRPLIEDAAKVYAAEMMRALLATPPD